MNLYQFKTEITEKLNSFTLFWEHMSRFYPEYYPSSLEDDNTGVWYEQFEEFQAETALLDAIHSFFNNHDYEADNEFIQRLKTVEQTIHCSQTHKANLTFKTQSLLDKDDAAYLEYESLTMLIKDYMENRTG